MNKAVELINLWDTYETEHPGATIEDFCRHTLVHAREKENKLITKNVTPIGAEGILLKTICRIAKINNIYANWALAGTAINQPEELLMLLQILAKKAPNKSEVIYYNLMELSSGTDVIKRLIKKGFIGEYVDQEDRRLKRLELTPKGIGEIEICIPRIKKLSDMLTWDLPADDIELCAKLLMVIDTKFTFLIHSHKGKSFDDIYKSLEDHSKLDKPV
jgi:DNA-binding MarR family transcriptional regulator